MEQSTNLHANLLSTRSGTTMVVVLLVILAGCTGLGFGGGDDGNGDGNESMPFMNHTATGSMGEFDTKKPLHRSELVTFNNQTSDGETVTIRTITVPEGGYAVVHDIHFLDTKNPSAIGVSEYLAAGTHHNVTVTLFNVPGRNFSDSARLTETQRLFVLPHRETNNNRTLDLVTTGMQQDRPYLNETDHIHFGTAIVTVADD